MERVAGCILPHLHQEYRLIAVDQVAHVRMRMIGVHKLVLGHRQSGSVDGGFAPERPSAPNSACCGDLRPRSYAYFPHCSSTVHRSLRDASGVIGCNKRTFILLECSASIASRSHIRAMSIRME